MYVVEILGERQGEEAIVYLHGFLGSHRNWRRVAQVLGASYDHYLLDLPFHGKSQVSIQASFKSICTYLQQWLQQFHQTGKIHLIGHSFGGRILMCLNYAHLPRVVSVVIEDISPEPTSVHSKEKLLQFFTQVLGQSFPSKGDVEQFVKTFDFELDIAWLLGGLFKKNVNQRLIFNLDTRALSEMLRLSEQVDLWEGYQHISVPVCVIRGEKSNFISDVVFARMGRENPLAQLRVCKGAGHWAHIQDSEQFCKLVRQFHQKIQRLAP